MKQQRLYLLFIIGMLFLNLCSCSDNEVIEILDANEVASLADKCDTLFNSHIDAWDSRDPEALRLIYSEDIVHFDGRPLFEGIDSVVNMADFMFEQFPDWQMEAGETYISRDGCVGTWVNWGVFGFTEDDPGFEFDFLETSNGKISFWRLYYSQNFHQAIDHKAIVDDVFLLKFASVWSSGNQSEIGKLYTQDATLEDSLYFVVVVGTQQIKKYATGFFERGSIIKWNLVDSFAESEVESYFKEQYPFISQGGIFSIITNDAEANPCEVLAIVILTPDEAGAIQRQQIFYQAETLINCGWAK